MRTKTSEPPALAWPDKVRGLVLCAAAPRLPVPDQLLNLLKLFLLLLLYLFFLRVVRAVWAEVQPPLAGSQTGRPSGRPRGRCRPGS